MSDAQMSSDHNITSVIKRVHLHLRVGCRMSTQSETIRRDKAGAKLAAAKKKKREKRAYYRHLSDVRDCRNLLARITFCVPALFSSLSKKVSSRSPRTLRGEIIATLTCKLRKKNLKVIPIGRKLQSSE